MIHCCVWCLKLFDNFKIYRSNFKPRYDIDEERQSNVPFNSSTRAQNVRKAVAFQQAIWLLPDSWQEVNFEKTEVQKLIIREGD